MEKICPWLLFRGPNGSVFCAFSLKCLCQSYAVSLVLQQVLDCHRCRLCRIGCVLTSGEGDNSGIEMYFNETDNMLIVKVQYRKVICNVSGVVTCHVQHVMARSAAAMVEVGSWFYDQNQLMEVIHILEQHKVMLCAYVEKERDEDSITLGEVADLVARFSSN